jgi:hypothetical protein
MGYKFDQRERNKIKGRDWLNITNTSGCAILFIINVWYLFLLNEGGYHRCFVKPPSVKINLFRRDSVNTCTN